MLELPASKEDKCTYLPLVSYKLTIITGNCHGAGTSANVYLNIYGSNGDSGEQLLQSSGNDFQINNSNVFGLECPYLGDVSKILIRHDNSGFHPRWFLDKVIIQDGKGWEYVFLYANWVDHDSGCSATIDVSVKK